jgi:DNA helicase-2/ATP-dependent DNA helicase PcrA
LRRAAPSARIDFAAELNPQQLAAVGAGPGPALVIAGAGSGKTRTLTYRVAYLLENGVRPEQILLLTFTNKAAREMLERVGTLVPEAASGVWGGTFHSVGNRILRRHAEAAGFRAGFTILDRDDQEELIDSVIAGAGIDTKKQRFPKGQVVADILGLASGTGRPLGEVLAGRYPYFAELEPALADIGLRYEARKRSANAIDFDDLITKVVGLLRDRPEVAQEYRRRFRYLLVDEYQDTNRAQAEMVDLLAAEHRNVMVVGDDAQSIYSWRGADVRNILEFPRRYPGAAVYRIETNYRSVPEVLDVANAVIGGNAVGFEKHLVAARPVSGRKPALVPLGDGNQQAQFVAQRMLDLAEEGVPFSEMAVLYRAHFHSMEVQMALTQHGIPFQITSGLRFFEQAHVKDVAAFLKFAVNPADEVAFKRVAKLLPGIGPRAAETAWAHAGPMLSGPLPDGERYREAIASAKVPPKSRKAWDQVAHTFAELASETLRAQPAEMIRVVLEAVYDDYLKAEYANYEQRRDDLGVLENYARGFGGTAEFLDQLALVSGLEQPGELAPADETDAVQLSSVHQAKGLEWKIVFAISLCDGMFPGSRSLDDREALEEERRLFYVAVTRARDELYLTYPHLRFGAGFGDALQEPSRFLGEIPPGLLEDWEVSEGPF